MKAISLIALICLLSSSARSELSQTNLGKDELLSDDHKVTGLWGPNQTNVHELLGVSSCGAGQTSYSLPQTGYYPTTSMPAPMVSCSGHGVSNCQICVPSSPYYATPGYSNSFRVTVNCPTAKKNHYTSWKTYGTSTISGSYSAGPQYDFVGQVSCPRSTDYGWVRYEWCDGSNNYGSYVMSYSGSHVCTPTCGYNTCGSDGCGGYCSNCANGYTCNNQQCVAVCTPTCGYNTCGSDGCGGTCNNCANGYTCNNGQCVAVCTPTCGYNSCGSNGCGGYCNSCASGYTCNANHQCVATCTPTCGYNSCGSNGCGGYCNSCASGYTCNANHQCVATCTPTCGYNTCGSNGCGGYCNNCASGYMCNANHQCASTCTPTCGYNTCGSDGCGGICNNCANGYTCNGGHCVAVCTPTCGYNTCGSDGCGGTCNNCANGYSCNNGMCYQNTPPPPPPPTYPSCNAGQTAFYLPQTIDTPLPTDMGPSKVSCSKTTSYSRCQICAPNGRVYVQTVSSYAPQTKYFNISVNCGPQPKTSTYATWNHYGSARGACSGTYTAYPQDDFIAEATVSVSSDYGWVRYEWCDPQGYKGAWVTKYSGR